MIGTAYAPVSLDESSLVVKLVFASASDFLFVMGNEIPDFGRGGTHRFIAVEFAHDDVFAEVQPLVNTNNIIV